MLTVVMVDIRTKRELAALCLRGSASAEEGSSGCPKGEWVLFHSIVLSSHVPDMKDG